jgi:hypothetical protein
VLIDPIVATQSEKNSPNQSHPDAEPFADTRYRKLQFDRDSILQSAPQHPGVYGLFSALWIYIGEAQDIRSKLLEHLIERDSCIAHYQPSSFAYELLDSDKRLERHAELSARLQPLCRGRSFVYKTMPEN